MGRNMTNLCSRVMMAVAFCVLVAAASAAAQEPVPSPSPAAKPKPETLSEADPTRPVLWQIRNEYRDLKNGGWSNTVLFRHDRFTFRNLKVKGGAKGFVVRFDVPLNTVHLGSTTKAGLGDIYAQVLLIPRISRKFAFSVGSGVILPTATHDTLGQGKLIIAPVAVPLWYLAKRRRLITFRMQHYISVAGKSSRADVNQTLVDPSIGWAVGRRAWIFANTEFKWDWNSKKVGAITGMQFGRMLSDRIGIWIKPEVPWGPGRTGGFNIKVGILQFR